MEQEDSSRSRFNRKTALTVLWRYKLPRLTNPAIWKPPKLLRGSKDYWACLWTHPRNSWSDMLWRFVPPIGMFVYLCSTNQDPDFSPAEHAEKFWALSQQSCENTWWEFLINWIAKYYGVFSWPKWAHLEHQGCPNKIQGKNKLSVKITALPRRGTVRSNPQQPQTQQNTLPNQ